MERPTPEQLAAAMLLAKDWGPSLLVEVQRKAVAVLVAEVCALQRDGEHLERVRELIRDRSFGSAASILDQVELELEDSW